MKRIFTIITAAAAFALFALISTTTLAGPVPIVRLAWDYPANATGVDHFNIYIKTTSLGVDVWDVIGTTAYSLDHQFVLPPLPPGPQTFLVTAVSATGVESLPSNEATIPGGPTNLRVIIEFGGSSTITTP